MSRYDIQGGESEYEPGSNDLVLRNLLRIVDPQQMDLEEWAAYIYFTRATLGAFEDDRVFSATQINELHYRWLGSIYPFAGKYREVNISKGGFAFCSAQYIPEQMMLFDQVLSRNMPCKGFNQDSLIKALAEVHGELILIHPYREGNGRLARWIASLMALQAGFPILDFDAEKKESARERYFTAVRRFATDPSLLEGWFSEVLKRADRLKPASS